METKLSVGNTNAGFALIRVPRDLGDRALNLIGVLEDHHSLSVDDFSSVLGLLTFKVLLEQINLVVLTDALLS